MKTWISFCRRNFIWFLLIVVMLAFQVLYLFLIGRPVDDLIYAGVLDLCIIAFAACVAFILYYKKVHDAKNALEQSSSGELKLPETEDILEELLGQCAENANIRRQLAESASARQQSEMKDYYAKWVHQIKTPIAAMRMILQEEDTQTNLDLRAELFRVEQYVEMVLSYIRLESSESDFVFRTCRLDDVIRQAIHKYASQFIRKKLRLVYEPTDVEVLTDEKWLLFILEQLLSNAVKYTQTGTITIEVSDDKRLMVRDTGIGIAAEDLPRIFEKGFTGYNGRNDKKATGLGLNLCRKTADKLGIRIAAESEAGKGSCFTLDLKERQIDIE